MRRLSVLATSAILVLLAVPSTAQEAPTEYIPTFTRSDFFLHRNTSPIGNVDAREGRFVKWDTTAPTSSTPAVYVGHNLSVFTDGDHVPQNFLTMKGKAAGDLSNIALELYFHGWAQSASTCGLSLSFELVVDDKTLLYQEYTGSNLGKTYQAVDATTAKVRVALTNLWEASKLEGIATGPGVEHDIYLNIQNFYLCNELVWMYDSVDRPASLIVNLPEPRKKGYVEVNVLDPPPPVG